MNKPEISRVSPFEGNDIVQIFGENLDKDTKLYVWYNAANDENDSIRLTKFEQEGGSLAALAYKMKLAQKATTEIKEENYNGKIESLLPLTPPDDCIVLDADDVADKVIYFGEKSGPNPDANGKHIRVDYVTSVMWLKNEAGFSKPYIANRPEIWNLSVDEIYPGGHVSIYGVSLGRPVTFSDGTHFAKRSMLRNRETGEFVRPIAVEETSYWNNVQKYTADFIVPADTPAGEYDVFVHSGKCGIFGWSEPKRLVVKKEMSLIDYYRHKWNRMAGSNPIRPECKVIRIAADKGPLYDYAADMQKAIDELSSSGGGILALSSGSYSIGETVYVKSGVVLLGEGSSTVIKACEDKLFYQDLHRLKFAVRPDGARGWANDWFQCYFDHRQAGLLVLENNCGTDSIRLELGDGVNLGIIVANGESDRAENVFINKTEVDGRCLSELENDGLYGAICAALVVGARTKNFVAWSSTFISTYATQILPARHEQMVFVNNVVNCHPRQVGESHISGLRNSVVANNTFIGGRRAFVGQGGLSYNWIYQNRTQDVGRAGGAEENYMSEHGEGEWNGKALDFGSNYITVAENSISDIFINGQGEDVKNRLECYNRYVFIIAGRGFGQYFKVEDVVKVGEGKYNIIFDKEFKAQPDSTTYYSMVYGTHHNLWIDNSSTLTNGHTQFVWNCGFENYVVGHQMEMAAGVYMHGLGQKKYRKGGSFENVLAVDCFNTFSECQTRSSGVGIKFTISADRTNYDNLECEEYNYSVGTFGNCVRNCTFDGTPGLIYVKNLWSWGEEPYPVGIHLVGGFNRVVANKIRGYETCYALLGDYKGNCFAKNITTGHKQLTMGEGTPIGEDFR